MALSGSLYDFDISYIFQIIAQEGKAGKLVLSSEESEGYVVFKQGKIISAGTNRQNLQSMLNKYLLHVKKYPENEIMELRVLYHNNLRHLITALLDKNYLTEKEISTIVETGIEDIACSIFLWKRGNYRFDTLPNVDIFQFDNYSLSADAITMEAARRIDDWDRINKSIKGETVFIRSGSAKLDIPSDQFSPLENFSEYLYAHINGTYSAEFLCQESFFSEYQVFATLFELMQEKMITPLPDTISSTISAALRRSDDSFDITTSKVLLSTIITATVIISIYFIGTIVFKGILFSNSIAERHLLQSELIRSRSNQKIAIATLHYQANKGTPPLLFSDLVKSGVLEKRDLTSFISSSIKGKKTKQGSP